MVINTEERERERGGGERERVREVGKEGGRGKTEGGREWGGRKRG